MNCPRCKEPVETRNIGEIEIDECPKCEGLWFDQGEFEQVKDQADPDLEWWKFDIWAREDQFKVAGQPIPCPKCSTEMFAVNYESTNVEIDVCSQCRGVWLDGGEFDKILEALNNELATAKVSDYVKASLREGKEIFTGPDGVKSEWKDFTTVLRLMQYRIFIKRPRMLNELMEGQKGAPIW